MSRIIRTAHFVIGFAAGVLDRFGAVRLRDAVYDSVCHSGPKIDGFDAGVDLFR